MTTEEKLKAHILTRYNSLLEFSKIAGISNSTLDSMLTNGIHRSKVSNVLKICRTLKISADELALGNIVSIESYKKKDRILEVNDIMQDVKNQLVNLEGLTLDGETIDEECIKSLVHAIEVGVEIAKKNKQNHNINHNKNHNKNDLF